ncbi:MAG TPA: nucleotidyltransferase domain-containing protein [Candidatus Angelobacter sp.]|nr:nucleotidyltransferase domain-containing protein [Candidatus Angelobacter sp.]
MDVQPRLLQAIAEHPYPLLFVTISGAHLYGFPSEDSDWDLRGVHLLPAIEFLALRAPRDETVEASHKDASLELDLVTHDARKFFSMMLKRNGYVLEQLLSPLILKTSTEHEELKSLAAGCVTRWHAHHYLGFAENQWSLFLKEDPPRAKPLLYVFRVLLTGIHLMRTGRIEANLIHLNDDHKLPYIADLISRKTGGGEKGRLRDVELSFFQSEYERLLRVLGDEASASQLPAEATAEPALNDLLLRLRARSEEYISR